MTKNTLSFWPFQFASNASNVPFAEISVAKRIWMHGMIWAFFLTINTLLATTLAGFTESFQRGLATMSCIALAFYSARYLHDRFYETKKYAIWFIGLIFVLLTFSGIRFYIEAYWFHKSIFGTWMCKW